VTRNAKLTMLAAAGAAVAIAGGGAAVAATGALSPEEESQAVIDDAAQQLGVEPNALSDALKDALKARLDAAVADGRLSQEQADELKERIDSGDSPLVFGGLGLRGFGHVGHFGHLAGLDGAASYLGLTEAELRAELEDGKSLADVAKAEGKSVDGLVQKLVDSASDRLDQAVEDGGLTRARADEIKQDLEAHITDLVNREPGAAAARGFARPGGHRSFEHGFGRFGGDPPFFGSRA
jgi:polyhydroxyalkanoate synthesis regulator phasin